MKMEEAPHPRVFCKKRLDLVDCKGVDFFEKDKEVASCWEYGICHRGAEAQGLEGVQGGVTPRGFCIDVKGKELRKKGFVTL